MPLIGIFGSLQNILNGILFLLQLLSVPSGLCQTLSSTTTGRIIGSLCTPKLLQPDSSESCNTSSTMPSLSLLWKWHATDPVFSFVCALDSYPDAKLEALKPNKRVVKTGFLYRYTSTDAAVPRQGFIVDEGILNQCRLRVRPVFVNKDFMVRPHLHQPPDLQLRW